MRVIDGVFKGVIGKVARYHGQQRVAIIIEGLMTVASALCQVGSWKTSHKRDKLEKLTILDKWKSKRYIMKTWR